MCDTISVQSNWSEKKQAFFAKNSDREPGEPQILIAADFSIEDIEKFEQTCDRKEYREFSLKNLIQAVNSDLVNSEISYSALLSSPIWMWGAEIGVNQWGLSIGNEAVFGRGKTEETALLGMDILRLTLHQCKTALEAVDFISKLVERFGQGGNGSYYHSFFYDNSYIIQDKNSGWVIETSGKKWCAKEIKNYASISNTYTLESDFSCSNIDENRGNLKKTDEKRVLNFLAGGEARNKFKKSFLEESKNTIDLERIKDLLRAHMSRHNRKKKGMRSICIHNMAPFNSESTASMIVEYNKDGFLIWYTGNSFPCLSLYKPLLFDKDLFKELNLYNREECLVLHIKRQNLVSKMNLNHKRSVIEKMPQRDTLEDEFSLLIETNRNDLEGLKKAVIKCHEEEDRYLLKNE